MGNQDPIERAGAEMNGECTTKCGEGKQNVDLEWSRRQLEVSLMEEARIGLRPLTVPGDAGTNNLPSTDGLALFEDPYGSPGIVATVSCTGKRAGRTGRNPCERILVYPTL